MFTSFSSIFRAHAIFIDLGSVCILQLYDVVRKEIWYRPDMFFFRDMLMMLARNKKVDEANRVWRDLRREEVLFDQHTFGDITRAFLDNGFSDRGDGHI